MIVARMSKVHDKVGWQWLGVYLYRADGTYSGAEWAKTPEEFRRLLPSIQEQIKNRGEVRIANIDDHLVFHATDKGIEWDGLGLAALLCGE
ncbi:MAG: hypothetical protein JO323_14675 [Acidobacteriia bacterium]|nr:hypothetical protein [Terriglobia bacterium]